MKSKELQGVSFASFAASSTLLHCAGGVDLSKGCPLMFTNHAETKPSDEAPQFVHVSTDWQDGMSAWYLAPQLGQPFIGPRMGDLHDQHVGTGCCDGG